jgi:putative FmdB family regulatory protein
MPLYEYHCEGCNNDFEEMVPFHKCLDMNCPKCKKKARKKISLPQTGIVYLSEARDGSSFKQAHSGVKVSSRHYDDIRRRSFKKSEKAKYENGELR